jgi:hypothetical protein
VSIHLACSPTQRAWLTALALVLLPASTLAQTPPAPAPAPAAAEPPGYRAAIDEAIAEYGAARYPEARALFMRAHALQPSARTLRGLGMTEFELRNYVEATRFLQQALSSTVRALDGELRSATEALLTRAQGFVGRYALALTPPELTLKVNSAPAPREPDGTLMLAIGDHALHAAAEGYTPISHTLRVTGGENTTLNITLERAPAAPVAVAPVAAQPEPVAPPSAVTPTSAAPPRDDDGGSVFSSPWFWTVAAVVVIGAGVGVTLLVLSEDAGVEPTHGGSTGAVLVAP